MMKHSLSSFHTFHLPANATQIIEFTSVEQLLTEWQKAFNAQMPILILGQGSNVLFLEDFDGVVLVNKLKGIEYREDEQFHYLHVQGGENWHELVKWTLARNIAGIENLALIPGVVGSAPIQNIGAYGVEFEQVCDFIEVLNLRTGERFTLSKEECGFGYRESVFKHQYRDESAIISVGLKFAKAWQPVLTYGSLTQFDPQTVTPQQILMKFVPFAPQNYLTQMSLATQAASLKTRLFQRNNLQMYKQNSQLFQAIYSSMAQSN